MLQKHGRDPGCADSVMRCQLAQGSGSGESPFAPRLETLALETGNTRFQISRD